MELNGSIDGGEKYTRAEDNNYIYVCVRVCERIETGKSVVISMATWKIKQFLWVCFKLCLSQRNTWDQRCW